MAIQINFSILILCTIAFQGIASLSDNITTDALDLLVRKKRIIDTTQCRNRRPQLQDVPYVVQIRHVGETVCSGTILSNHVVLTTAQCLRHGGTYINNIAAGTVSVTGYHTNHFVNGILIHPNYNASTLVYNIALVSILEPILFLGRGYNRPIEIYQSRDGQLPRNTVVTTSGWGQIMDPNRYVGANELRSISVPTISLQECEHRHPELAGPIIQYICTYHPEKTCNIGDQGNPLVYGQHLVGILSQPSLQGPNVFMNVALPVFRNWIIEHMNRIPPRATQAVHQPTEPVGRIGRCSKVHPCHI